MDSSLSLKMGVPESLAVVGVTMLRRARVVGCWVYVWYLGMASTKVFEGLIESELS